MKSLQTAQQMIPGLVALAALSMVSQTLPASRQTADFFVAQQGQDRPSERLPDSDANNGPVAERRTVLGGFSSRPFRMGFTGFVHDTTPAAVTASRRFVRENGDILSHHIEGVPWTQALNGQPFPKVLLEEWEGKKLAAPPKGKIYLAISPGRGELQMADKAGPLPPELDGKRYDDPLVIQTYLSYCRRAIEFFKPDYLAIGIEVNEIHNLGPGVWDAYVTLHKAVYVALKKDHPALPVFASWTLHNLFKQRGPMLEQFKKLMPFNDLVAVSYYPFFMEDRDRLAALDWMFEQFDAFQKPYAVVETNDAAERLPLPQAKVVIEGTPDKQAAYYRRLLALAQRRDFVFVISFIHQDYDALWEKIKATAPELFMAWRDCGLLDENGKARPALQIWADYFNLPLSKSDTQRMVFPGKDWLQAEPGSQGIDPMKLKAALDYLGQSLSEHGGTRTLFMVRNGYVIWAGSDSDREYQIFSATKSFTSTILGLLIQDGKISLNTLAKDIEPALAEYYSGVTFRHFATMTSGYDSAGGSYEFDLQGRGDSWNPGPPAPPLFTPGTKFRYWDDAMSQFGNVLTKAAQTPLDQLFKARIADPIGMTRWRWTEHDTPTGRVLSVQGGIWTSSRELARFGHLFLNLGTWDSRQLIDASWVDQATSVQVSSSVPNDTPPRSRGAGVYGYNWWVNGVKASGQRLWPGAPPRTYYANGLHNNVCIVIPEWQMVIARTNGGRNDGSANTPANVDEIWSGFFKRLAVALP